MKYVGAHVSIEGGVANAPLKASEIGARSFAIFTKNASRWKGKPISEADAELFRTRCEELDFSPELILPHDSFLINLGAPDSEKLRMSRDAFIDELRRCEQLGLTMLNFHPGSHLGEMEPDACLDLIADSINIALENTSGVAAILENTAGQGSNLGFRFEQLARIINRVDDKDRIGVCIDTCHAYSAGYNLATPEGYAATWTDFDNTIGASYLRAIHLNDDKKAFGSRVDRHASIGTGTIGSEFFTRLMNDPRFDDMPIILETPDPDIWPQEIEWLYSRIRQ